MDLKNGVFHGRPAYWLAILVLLAGLLLSLLWAVTFGSVDLKMGDVYRVILYKVTEALHFPVGDSEVYGSGSMSDIVWFVRLPRLVLAIGVGMALALAGVVMQAMRPKEEHSFALGGEAAEKLRQFLASQEQG